MKDFVNIGQLQRAQMEALINKANAFKCGSLTQSLAQHTAACMFYENSTRTRISFEMAAQRLSMPLIHVDLAHSSEQKGEVMTDTISNLAAMGIDRFIIRHEGDNLFPSLSQAFKLSPIHFINAGSGKTAHPSQAMLDMMTLLTHKPDLADRKVVIVGNLKHSRVASSLMAAFKLMGLGKLMLISPDIWQPENLVFGQWTDNLLHGLRDADAVIGLRVQTERLQAEEKLDLRHYQKNYRIDQDRLALAKKDAIVMHPGPVNRGVEMTSEIIDGPQSCILEQVSNGVFMRMAILSSLS